ncbi:MAG: D-alanine--D-alanine ligase [Treponematales bacterium]
MGKRLNVGILFGGRSAEHEVSLQSAKNVFDAIDRERFNPVLLGIDKEGRWRLPPAGGAEEALLHAGDPRRISLNASGGLAALAPGRGGAVFRLEPPGGEALRLDAVFPLLHGPFGEDGTVQGLLALAAVPFVGSGVLGSAVGMDKDVMKRLLRDAGLPVGRFRAVSAGEETPGFTSLAGELGLPLFVKPANMGSSVGVSKVHCEAEYLPALNGAFAYDTKAVVEEFIAGREIECAVLGGERPEASLPGEVKSRHEFYSYDAKYLDADGAALEIPARLPEAKAREIQSLARETFRALSCEGLARVDFFLKEDGAVLINEINTMPGFTRISMYPKLWEASGVSYTRLISRLIDLAVERFEKTKNLRTSAA